MKAPRILRVTTPSRTFTLTFHYDPHAGWYCQGWTPGGSTFRGMGINTAFDLCMRRRYTVHEVEGKE